ncbi:Tic20 family protein [Prochlorococcus sp. MIT 0602]|uniref:Tic20 family protein n=2 Tax=Prochlorococcus TaxID=1218 RepID=UPI001F4C6AAF|nr:Tic20 family protein [Prochlorococcus sp. MIT 0602]
MISVFLYMLPWADAIKYGNDIFTNFPISQLLIYPALPVLIIEQALPIGNLLIFLLLFLGVARNEKISYFLRLNCMQSILMTLILIIFNYLMILFVQLTNSTYLLEILKELVFIGTLTTVIFTSTQCLRGLEANLPGISDAAKMQI